jgi:hypothetical protein
VLGSGGRPDQASTAETVALTELRPMELAGKYLVVCLSLEAIETFLGVLDPAQVRAMTTGPSPATSWTRRVLGL